MRLKGSVLARLTDDEVRVLHALARLIARDRDPAAPFQLDLFEEAT